MIHRTTVLAVADQLCSSAGNALLLVVLARTSEPSSFGWSALALLVLTSSMGLIRGLLGTPLLLLSHDDAGLAREVPRAAGAASLVGAVLAVCGTLAWWVADLPLVCLVLAWAAPVVLLQDTLRFAGTARGSQGRVLLSDLVWLVASITALLASTVLVLPAVAAGTLWLVGAVAGAAVLVASGHVRPVWGGLRDWARQDGRRRAAFGGEAALASLTPLAVAAVVTGVLGSGAVGTLRGTTTFTGPVNALISALPMALVPWVLRGQLRSGREVWRALRMFALLLTPVGLVVAALPWLLPQRWGMALLGPTWSATATLLLWSGLECVGLCWMNVAAAGLRARGAGGRLLGVRAAFSAASLMLVILTTTAVGDLRWVAAGAALLAGTFAIVTVVVLRTSGAAEPRREHVASALPTSVPSSTVEAS